MRALAALVAFAALAAPARAADVARLPLGQSIDELVVGADGGAWVGINPTLSLENPSIGRANPDGSFRAFPVKGSRVWGATLGPDGQAWFTVGPDLLRVDAAGTSSTVPVDLTYDHLATGPDAVWAIDDDQVLRIGPQGVTSSTPLRVPGCDHVNPYALAGASDGALWVADNVCGLIRIAPDGSTRATELDVRATDLAADPAGGLWFASDFEWRTGHIDAAGTVRMLASRRYWHSVAVAPDGSAWFAGARCTLMRSTPQGALSFVAAPIAADQVAFDPLGKLWLASPNRLVHDEPAGTGCDDTPPRIDLSPIGKVNHKGSGSVSLAALRRTGALRIRLREPVAIEGYLSFLGEDEPFVFFEAVTRGAQTLRFPLGPHRLRAIARHQHAELDVILRASDIDGNMNDFEVTLKVRP